jgi:coenzyme F420-0:L-glutamate ligase/coenzyme F420-1:gamma-L-glutamate ligase
VTGLPEVQPGDDIGQLLLVGLAQAGLPHLREGDIMVVSSKVVSKAEGRLFPADQRDAVIEAESVRLVARRGTMRIVENRQGFVMAAAGVDASNAPPGTVLALPVDPDRSARRLWRSLRHLTGLTRLGVVLADTFGRPWRLGQTDAAIGAAGVVPLADLRGTADATGRELRATQVAVADELAAATELVRAKAAGVAAAVVRGLGHYVTAQPGPGARALLMPASQDLFRHGADQPTA